MSIYSDFAGSTLLHKGGGVEPQRKAHFAVVIYGVGGSSLALQLKDTDLPPRSVVRKGIKYFNETSHYAGSIEPPADWNLNYRDYIDMRGWEILSAWHKQVADESGKINFAGVYKKCAEILYLDPQGNTHRKYRLEGVFPTSLKGDGFDHDDDGENHLIQLVCSTDRVLPPGF